MTDGKRCARCGETKPLDDFPDGKKWSDGKFPYCRVCKRAAERESHARNRAKRNAKMREHYAGNKEPYKARARAQYAADPAAGAKRAAAWAAANPERAREIRIACERRSYAINPERKREVFRRRYAAIRRGCAVLPFTTEQLAAKVAYWGGLCWMCSAPYESIDHVKPLNKGGAHILSNLRPACGPCNTRKRDHWPIPQRILERSK